MAVVAVRAYGVRPVGYPPSWQRNDTLDTTLPVYR